MKTLKLWCEKVDIKEVITFVFLSVPIALLLCKMLLDNLTPTFDADIHNHFISYLDGRKGPNFFSTLYLQSLFFRPFDFHIDTIILISRIICSTIFFISLVFLSCLKEKYFYFKLALLCSLCLNVNSYQFWFYVVTHGLWYYSLNALFLSLFLFHLNKGMKEISLKDFIFIFVFCFAIFNRLSFLFPFLTCLVIFLFKNPKKLLFF